MLRWIEGFEGFGTSAGSTPTGMATKYTVTSSDSDLVLRAGRFSGFCMEITIGLTKAFQTPALTAMTTITVGFAMRQATYGNIRNVLQILDGTTVHGTLRMNTSGEFSYFRGTEIGTQLGSTTSGASIMPGQWFYVELVVKIADSGGTVDLYINGTNVLSVASADTRNGGNASVDRAKWISSSADACQYDDIYVLDDTGSVNNSRLGSHKVIGSLPSGAGSSTQFTPSAGSNYQCVDDNPTNSDTDYVESGTSGHKDLYDYASIGTLANIKGLQINTVARETDGSPFSLYQTVKSGSTNSDGSSVAISGQTFKTITPRVLETDPDTSSAWTDSGVDAAEFGIKVA